MSLDADLFVDRRRLKRRLGVWRVIAVLAVLGCLFLAFRPSGAVSGPHVARLSVTGVISEDRRLTDAVTDLAKDNSVKALIVYVDSPGGSVAGGEALHDAISKVAAKKPVVTVMAGTAASAGYMISVPAARIFARESTLTGSIGVILETGDVSGLLAHLGIAADPIVSGPLKGQPSFVKPLSPQGREVLQALVLDLYDQFVGIVASGRHMDPAAVRALADGRAYTGRQALKLGLIDAIGGEPEAREWLASEKKVSADLPVQNVRSGSLVESVFTGNTGETLGGLLGTVLGSAAKNMIAQRVSVDGAWALWQPPGVGE